MRGTFFKSSYNFSVARRRSSQTYFLLVFAIIFAAVSSGCASVSANKPSAEPATAQISVVPSAIDFKAVVVGQKNSQTVKITNSSSSSINLQNLHISGSGFSLSSATAPVLLAPGSQLSLSLDFAPPSVADHSGSLVISAAELKTPVTVPL